MLASNPATQRATTLAFANHKGGCGKTTSVANVGAALAERGHRVLLIDADPQANLGEAFAITSELEGPRLEDALEDRDADTAPIWNTTVSEAVDVIPCSARLEAVVTAGAGDPAFPFALRDLTADLADAYDVILIDTPPGLGPLSSMAMLAAEWVIAPVRPADFDVGGALKLAELVAGDLSAANPRLRLLGVLLTQVDRRWTLAHDTREALEVAGVRRLKTEIPFRVRVGAAARHGAPTTVLEPDSLVAHAYRTLASDIDGVLLGDRG